MTRIEFTDFARTTLSGAINLSDKSPLTPQQIERITTYLESPASGPDGNISYADFVAKKLEEFPPILPETKDYIAFSGRDRSQQLNYSNSQAYINETKDRAGIIGDTPWGKYIQSTENLPEKHPELGIIKDKFEAFMTTEGATPYGKDYGGALRDIM